MKTLIDTTKAEIFTFLDCPSTIIEKIRHKYIKHESIRDIYYIFVANKFKTAYTL